MIGLRSKEANLENLLQNVMKLGNGSLCLTVLATITRVILLLQGLDVHGEEKALAMETVDTRKELPLRNMMRFFPMDKSFPLNTSKTSMNQQPTPPITLWKVLHKSFTRNSKQCNEKGLRSKKQSFMREKLLRMSLLIRRWNKLQFVMRSSKKWERRLLKQKKQFSKPSTKTGLNSRKRSMLVDKRFFGISRNSFGGLAIRKVTTMELTMVMTRRLLPRLRKRRTNLNHWSKTPSR